jgi:hypothetical protein
MLMGQVRREGRRRCRRIAELAPLGGVERPRRVVRFARLMQRRGRAFWRTYGPRRLRRQLEPGLVATDRGLAERRVNQNTPRREQAVVKVGSYAAKLLRGQGVDPSAAYR